MKSVVVIGGGFAGSVIAKNLQKDFNVTLIDDKDYFEFTPSVLKTLVNPIKINKIRVMHKKYLKKANVLMGNVKDIDKEFVYLNKDKIKYDYLAICSGSNYSLPIKAHNIIEAARSKSLIGSYNSLVESKKIVIIGGGLVGVELAGEIITHFPEKEVTIVSSSERLVPRNSIKAIDYVEKFLTKRNVKIIKGEKIISFKNNTYKSDKGNSYIAEIGYICTGITSNYEFMKNNFKLALDERNQIIVNEYLQVIGQKNIFSAGDINNIKVEKTAQSAVKQAKIICENINSLEKGKEISKYEHKIKGMLISLGKYDGVLESKNFILRGKIPALMKYLLERFEMLKYR